MPVLLLLFLFSYPLAVLGHVHYVDAVPNALNLENVAAVGHVDPKGGSTQNAFGKDFAANGHKWTVDLCNLDSDGDGETNGQELGDPCCIWKVGEIPMRKWQLGHPGKREWTSGVSTAANCTIIEKNTVGDKHFWSFYYSGYDPNRVSSDQQQSWGNYLKSFLFADPVRDEGPQVGRCGAQFGRSTCGSNSCCSRNNYCGTEDDHCLDGCQGQYGTCKPLPWMAYIPTLDLQDRSSTAKNKFTYMLLALTAVMMYMGTWRDFKQATWRRHATFLVLSYLYIDMLSGFLHVTLDNPLINSWPVIGKEAQGFQGHHYDPSAIARGGWGRFLQTVHAGQLAVTISFILHPRSGPLRMFLCWGNVMMPLMMASHRWSHTPPAVTPLLVRLLQFGGILISPEHHSIHHAHFDSNFCIFGGWIDVPLNFITKHIMGVHNPWWSLVLLLWGVFPLIMSFEVVYSPVIRRMSTAAVAFEQLIAEQSPTTAMRLRKCFGRSRTSSKRWST